MSREKAVAGRAALMPTAVSDCKNFRRSMSVSPQVVMGALCGTVTTVRVVIRFGVYDAICRPPYYDE
jgi:hypothetical protein